MNLVRCPSCELLDDWTENPLKPYCSAVCKLLWRYGLAWRIQPYRIVVNSHPHLIVQAGPHFDVREPALKGARERILATERKRRQRAARSVRNVTRTAHYNPSIEVHRPDLGAKNLTTEGNLDPLPAKS
jgi:endogenous inhibitor of DNA gyrase (YacG/DUF329 family)